MLAWTVLWFLIIYDSPSDHPRISEEEKIYIIQSQGSEKVSDFRAIFKWIRVNMRGKETMIIQSSKNDYLIDSARKFT